MSELNPYAPPGDSGPGRDEPTGDEGTNAYQQGGLLLVPAFSARLPDRCVVCNAPAPGYRLQKTFYWHPPAVYLALMLGALPYVIAAAITRKRAHLALGLCGEHRARRRNGLFLAWGGFVLGLVVMFAGAMSDNSAPEGLLAGIALMIVLPITGGIMARVATPKRIDDHYAWMKVGQPFLDSLPRG